METTDNIVRIFYAIDSRFVNYALVSIKSLIDHINYDRKYHIHILHTGIEQKLQNKILRLKTTDKVEITFEDVTDYVETVKDKLPVRDYYSLSTYYRIFISEMFPFYNKALYIDADTIVLDDVAKLYDTDMGGYYLAGTRDSVVTDIPAASEYVEKCLGIDHNLYFCAGVVLMNCEAFRDHFILDKFIQLVHSYTFKVAQDQDYLNVILKDHILFVNRRWNVEMATEVKIPFTDFGILHYNFAQKPWHYRDSKYGFVFWQYAKETEVYDEILEELNSYTDEQRKHDDTVGMVMLENCIKEANDPNNYLCRLNKSKRAKDRVAVLNKIQELETKGIFDQDVEEDPVGKTLMPEDIDYIHKSLLERMKRQYAFFMAKRFLHNLIANDQLIINEIDGVENIQNLNSGAVITCNHFSPYDSFAVQMAYEVSDQNHREFYRVIKESNYTSYPGFYGFLMRHCNTLPLSSNLRTMKKFIDGVKKHLMNGNFVLIYPEQSLWWNYRKPKPLKKGAFTLAAQANVPVLPIFITMEDTDKMGEDGFPIQAYTIHICKPIYPEACLSKADNAENMMEKNYQVWKDIYEDFYQTKLTYLCDTIKE